MQQGSERQSNTAMAGFFVPLAKTLSVPPPGKLGLHYMLDACQMRTPQALDRQGLADCWLYPV